MLTLLFGWAAVTGLAVLVLYARDPYAAGRHRAHAKGFMDRVKSWSEPLCAKLRSRGLCPPLG